MESELLRVLRSAYGSYKVNLNFGVDEDEGPHEDLNEHEVSEEASD